MHTFSNRHPYRPCLDYWRDYLINKGFDSPYCAHRFYLGVPTPIRGIYYVFKYKKFKILIDCEKFHTFVVEYDDCNVNTACLITMEKREELDRIINAIVDPTDRKFLLCIDIDWAKPIIEKILKSEECVV